MWGAFRFLSFWSAYFGGLLSIYVGHLWWNHLYLMNNTFYNFQIVTFNLITWFCWKLLTLNRILVFVIFSIVSNDRIYWTTSMERLYFLVERCYRLREPVLLVGETGGGKTSVCQLISMVFGSKLHILNCHQFTETTDFIGVGFHLVTQSIYKIYCIKVFVLMFWVFRDFILSEKDPNWLLNISIPSNSWRCQRFLSTPLLIM